ncbi:SAM-dependent methyltransferase [Frankia sp. R82]|uniref:SAM-dependent methyltransferase n=1 Tax=Frankia sp. R82 TaxID=2950553 RepID=UPI00204494A3|nr:SAM-dependent methyltransferase [Frankia sp. R82]MCM3887152.1 SAM-dependent methyltransferase [Frankia sp. R82]
MPSSQETRGDRPDQRVDLSTDRPHSARIYNYLLGGTENFAADREAAAQAMAGFPDLQVAARHNRAFMTRAVRYLAAEAGIRQFLDLGSGIPTSPNVHEVAQAVAPDARVVYCDDDPIVLAHARALLTGTPGGATAYLDADLRDVGAILASAEVRDTLDLTRPVAVSLIAVLHFLPDDQNPHHIVRRLLAALPAGSYLVLTHGTGDFDPPGGELGAQAYRNRGIPLQSRSRDEIARLFTGLDLVDPGIVALHRWHPDDTLGDEVTNAQVSMYGVVGRTTA